MNANGHTTMAKTLDDQRRRKASNDTRRKPPRQLLSRVDWGSFGNSITSSLTWGATPGSGATSSAAVAAAAALASMGHEGSDPYGPSRRPTVCTSNLSGLAGADRGNDVEETEAENGSGLTYGRMIVVIASVGIIACAAVLIAAIVTNDQPSISSDAAVAASGQQRLLEIAEEVVSACGENTLDNDSSDCQKLCNGYMCCFEEDHLVHCKDDPEKDCAVYAGCRALIEDVPANGASPSVGMRKWG